MNTKKMNIEVSISRNYNKVTLQFLDEPVEFEATGENNEEDALKLAIRKKLKLLHAECEIRLNAINGPVQK